MAVGQLDYYELLGIEPGASPDQVRSAYRRLIRVDHPDVGGTDGLARLLAEAYETLADPARRFAYDAERAEPVEGSAERATPFVAPAQPRSTQPGRARTRWGVARVVRAVFVVWVVAVIVGELASPTSRCLGLFVAGLWAVGLARRYHRRRRIRRLDGC